MKKVFLALVAFVTASLAVRAADTVELLPGKIAGTVTLTSETVVNGSISANATDGSGSASASFTGSSYSLIVPAGKSWRLSVSLTLQSPSGTYLSFYTSLPDVVGPVAADTTLTQNLTLTTVRIAANVTVNNGTLTTIGSLQAYGNNTVNNVSTSFSASAQNLGYVVAFPYATTTVYGTATVKSTTNQTSTQSLTATSVNATVASPAAAWTLDAAFSAGSLQGTLGLTGAATPNSAYIYLYNPSGNFVGSQNLQGNGSYQFDNLMAGKHSLYTYAYFANSQLYHYRNAAVTAGDVTTVGFTGTVALAQVPLTLTGFLTAAKVSSANLGASWMAPSPNTDNISLSANAGLNSTGNFTLVLTAGDWRINNVNLSGYDSSTPGVQYYYSLGLYDYQRANQNVTFAAGDNKTIAGFSLNTTQTELTFDVIEPAGATSETLISNARVYGYSTTYSGSTPLQQLSFNSSTYTNTPQARPRVRIVGVPGIYDIQTYGSVSGSDVSFGNFKLELKAPLPTPVGTNVVVAAGTGVTLDFDQVTAAGVSTSSQLPVGPALPAGYTILTNSGAKIYYGISTTATFSGYVDVTIDYAADAVPSAQESRLKVLYYDTAAQKWLDVTIGVDQVNNKITGSAPALSLFAVAVTNDPVLSAVTVPTGGLKATSLAFSATYTDGDANDVHTAVWTWGDGTTSTATVNATTRTITGTHTFAQAGTYAGSLTITDATGNKVTKTFSTVVGGGDSTAPVITVTGSLSAEATSAAGATVAFTLTGTDDTDGTVTVTSVPASGAVFPLGNTTVTATARDAAGNVATKTFTVSVVDTTKPVIAAVANVTVEATSAAGAVATFTASASDNVGATVSYSKAPGSTFPVGTTTVTVNAADAAGNAATPVSFTVTVKDTTKPVIAAVANVTVEATSAAGAVATFTATASDNVGATVSFSKASGTVFPLGTTTVTANAVDAAGNAATPVTFTVTVRDTTAPTVTASLVNVSKGGDDESTQKFMVVFTSTDVVGVKTLKATLNGVVVTNGQIVQLQTIKSGSQTVKREDDGRLQIKATSFLLTVVATDAAANTTTKTATAVFIKNGQDGEKDDDKDGSKSKDDDK